MAKFSRNAITINQKDWVTERHTERDMQNKTGFRYIRKAENKIKQQKRQMHKNIQYLITYFYYFCLDLTTFTCHQQRLSDNLQISEAKNLIFFV